MVRASLTALPSDMVFGVGLGCLVQMLKTHSNVQVIFQNMLMVVVKEGRVAADAGVVLELLNVVFCLLLFLLSLKWRVC